MHIPIAKALVRFACVALLLGAFAVAVAAQSTDVAAPSPVRTNDVVGTIPARDLGDPRVTDHFYAFTGTPGDVLITVDSRNLNGDIDVFTFSGLQPLLKFTVYAGSSSAITKSIYLRKQEDLILRVEGRTPNDDEAVYRIHFGGSFAPLTSAPWLSESDNATPPANIATGTAATAKKGRRVSSVGARIDEPPAEVAEAPAPEPTPEAVEAAPKTAAAKPKPGNSRVRRPATRPGAKKPPAETAKADETAKNDSEANAPTENPESEKKKTPASKRPTRRTTTARTAKPAPAPAPPQAPEESGPRLLIETNDGTLIDRYMSSVRRVTVENGQVVVVGRDGKIQRISLATVVRMTISP
jgi:hypothetical protein